MLGKRLIYRGRVQGVGFRRRTEKLASGFAVAGFVRNLLDGSVELAVEGEEPAVQGFLAAIDREMRAEIDGVETEGAELAGYTRFTIAPTTSR